MPMHQRIIEHLMEDKSTFTSASDVIRRALEFYHDKTYPAYIFQLSPAAEDKKRKREAEEAEESISIEDYAANLGMVYHLNREGEPFILMHQIGNMVMAIPAGEFRDWAKKHPADMETHASKVRSTPVESMLTSAYMQTLMNSGYNIDLSSFKKEEVL